MCLEMAFEVYQGYMNRYIPRNWYELRHLCVQINIWLDKSWILSELRSDSMLDPLDYIVQTIPG